MKVKTITWKECTREEALKVIKHKFRNMTAFDGRKRERLDYLNRECLRGGSFTLEEVEEAEASEEAEENSSPEPEPPPKEKAAKAPTGIGGMITPETARGVQEYAREQMITRLLADIAADMQICAIEGWDPMEYPERLRWEMDRLTGRKEL